MTYETTCARIDIIRLASVNSNLKIHLIKTKNGGIEMGYEEFSG
jgi:hypothetical protein